MIPNVLEFATIEGERIAHIEEKPQNPASNFAVTGLYMYDEAVFEMIDKLEPSKRGELEITDVNNMYINRGDMYFDIVKGWWTDAGTIDSLMRASQLVAEKKEKKL